MKEQPHEEKFFSPRVFTDYDIRRWEKERETVEILVFLARVGWWVVLMMSGWLAIEFVLGRW